MRLPFGLALSVVLALFAVGPVAASSADTNLMQSGTSAVYFSQMCEGDESLAATCSTTFLFVLSGKTHDKVGHVITRNQACVEASVETFDESVERISFHGKFGCQTLRKGALSVDRLNSFMLRATLPVEIVDCGPQDCAPSTTGSVEIRATWTGTGPTTLRKLRDVYDDGVCYSLVAWKSASRDATFTGTLDGVAMPPPDEFEGAGLSRGKFRVINRNCGG